MTEQHPAVAHLLAAHERAIALAEKATKGPWTVDDEGYPEEIHGLHGADVVTGSRWAGEASVFDSDADALFIAANHPGTVLLRVTEERKILAEHQPHEDRPWACRVCISDREDLYPEQWESDRWPCATVLGLAAAWGWKAAT